MRSKSNSRGNGSGRLALASVLLPLVGLAQAIDIDALVSQADAIVSIEVAFVPYGDLVLPGAVVYGEPVAIASPNDLLGTCLPSKAVVRDLARKAENTPQAAVYVEALERAGYTATVFLKRDVDRIRVICDRSFNSTDNWERDPRYPVWRARLQNHLEDQNR